MRVSQGTYIFDAYLSVCLQADVTLGITSRPVLIQLKGPMIKQTPEVPTQNV